MMKKILALLLALIMLASCAMAEVYFGPATADTPEYSKYSDMLDDVSDELIQMIAGYLAVYEQTLDILIGDNAINVSIGSSDGETIEITIGSDYIAPATILLDGDGISYPAYNESYTYSEVLDMLMGFEEDGVMQWLIAFADIFNAEDLAFLETAGELAYAELKRVGVIPSVQEGYDETYFSLSITPDLIQTAAIRFIDQLLSCEKEINSLLNRAEPLLRQLIPDLYEVYDSGTGKMVDRKKLTCADLQALFDELEMSVLMNDENTFGGVHIDISGIINDDGWRIDGSYFDPDYEESLLLELSGDEYGHLEGMLEYCAEKYSSATSSYEYQATRFNISGALMDSGFTLSVIPETPMEGFSSLKINCFVGYYGMIVDIVTDLLDFRMELTEEALDISAVTYDTLLDLNLTYSGDVPQGSLLYRDYWDAYSIKLNEAN